MNDSDSAHATPPSRHVLWERGREGGGEKMSEREGERERDGEGE